MTIFSRETTSSLSRMTATVQLVKCTLFTLVCIVACLLLRVTTDRKEVVEKILVFKNEELLTKKADSSLINVVNNASESRFSILFEKEEYVQFGKLKLGTPIKPEEVQLSIQRVYDTCDKYNETETLRRKHFLFSPKHGALYCWIRKVASTSFTKFFGNLRGRRAAGNYYKQINFLAPQSLEELQAIVHDKRVFKFLLVRHPFERLVSSYRDRIEDNSRYTAQSWIYVPRIFHLTRPELFYTNGTLGNAFQNIFTPNRRLKLIPTFAEFVTWLLKQSPENDDDHWHQYNKHCSLCTANFDYILKLENYTLSDVNYIYSKLGLSTNRTDLPKLQSSRGGSTDFIRTCDYFSSLSRKNALRLYERYKIDFEMFNYKYEDYVNCANIGDETERPH